MEARIEIIREFVPELRDDGIYVGLGYDDLGLC